MKMPCFEHLSVQWCSVVWLAAQWVVISIFVTIALISAVNQYTNSKDFLGAGARGIEA